MSLLSAPVPEAAPPVGFAATEAGQPAVITPVPATQPISQPKAPSVLSIAYCTYNHVLSIIRSFESHFKFRSD